MRVLDLGCGFSDVAAEAFKGAEVVRVDLNPEAEPDVVADARALPESLGKFDHILASHLLEHLGRVEIIPALEHWGTFLVPGGSLHVIVPDLEFAAEELTRGKPTPAIAIMMHLYGAQSSEWDFHRWGFTALLLRSALTQAGYIVTELRSNNYTIRFDDKNEARARQLYARAVRKEH